jgi:alcohol dehydrogenase YqhD (iron-dependent ADH family)
MRKNNLFLREYNKIKQPMYDIHTIDVSSFCDKVVGYSSKSDTEKLDALLELDSMLYTELGISSSLKDKRETKKKSRIIYRAIKSFNKSLGDSFLQHMDADV